MYSLHCFSSPLYIVYMDSTNPPTPYENETFLSQKLHFLSCHLDFHAFFTRKKKKKKTKEILDDKEKV